MRAYVCRREREGGKEGETHIREEGKSGSEKERGRERKRVRARESERKGERGQDRETACVFVRVILCFVCLWGGARENDSRGAQCKVLALVCNSVQVPTGYKRLCTAAA